MTKTSSMQWLVAVLVLGVGLAAPLLLPNNMTQLVDVMVFILIALSWDMLSELGPAHKLIHASGTIPRRADVPLHVRIVGKEIAHPIEGDVIRVSQTDADHLPLLPRGIHATNPPARGPTVARVIAGCVLDGK